MTVAKIFKIPFAATGDKISPPDAVQPDGSVSYPQGYGFDYQRKTDGTDPLAKVFPREQHNGILNDITTAIGESQVQGLSSWQAVGGPYPINALVRHSGLNWRSSTANNTTEPGTAGANWVDAASQPQATEAALGVAMIATSAEVAAGTNDTKIVTPGKLRARLDLKANLDSPNLVRPKTETDLPEGDESTSIPNTRFIAAAFRRIVAQATELTAGIMRIGNQSEVNSGALDTVAVSPKKLRAGIAFFSSRNGYFAFPTWMGGLIVQWGYVYESQSNSDYRPFVIPFPSECYGINMSIDAQTVGGFSHNSGFVVGVVDRSKFLWSVGGTLSGGGYGYYWAWGK